MNIHNNFQTAESTQMFSPSKTNFSFEQSGGFTMFCQKQSSGSKKEEELDLAYNFQFYKEYKKLQTRQNEISSYIERLSQQQEEVLARVRTLQIMTETEFTDRFRKVHRGRGKRRPAYKMIKEHQCEVEGCEKSYVSEGSMLQHMRIKHPQSYELRQNKKMSIPLLSLQEMGLEL